MNITSAALASSQAVSPGSTFGIAAPLSGSSVGGLPLAPARSLLEPPEPPVRRRGCRAREWPAQAAGCFEWVNGRLRERERTAAVEVAKRSRRQPLADTLTTLEPSPSVPAERPVPAPGRRALLAGAVFLGYLLVSFILYALPVLGPF